MTRGAKISKLANAVRDYRGCRDAGSGQWRRQPNPSAKARVEKWLAELKLDVAETLVKIDGFVSGDQFRAWIRNL